jgi:hypothetical protein
MMSEDMEQNTNSKDLASIVSGLISNPNIISKINNILDNIDTASNSNNSPPNDNISSNEEEIENDNSNIHVNPNDYSPTFQNLDMGNFISKIPDILSKLSSASNENSIATKQQINLLLAVRPYLSERRKELIDSFIKINKFSSIFMSLGKEGEKNVLQ